MATQNMNQGNIQYLDEWRRLGNTGDLPVGWRGQGGTASGGFDDYMKKIEGEVNKYADELINFAKGDYDFAAKWIENNYKLAVGTDDTSKAEFLKKVANDIESKVGRIAFDYNTGTYRVNQDADLATTRTTRNSSSALKRLAEDEDLERRGLLRENEQARAGQESQLNERGILSTPRDVATGLAGREVGTLEAEIGDRMTAFERAIARGREDITTNTSDTLFDIGVGRTRSLEDLTTGARRGVIDEENERTYGLDSAARARDERIRQAEMERRKGKNQAQSYADYFARGAQGL